MPHIDLAFRLTGTTVPADHGYALYAVLSRLVPEIHDAKVVGVQPIRGVYGGDGTLRLAAFSRLILRLPDDQIRLYLRLAGKKLEVDGYSLRVGIPEVRALHPAVRLRARLVTIKGFLDEGPFLEAAKYGELARRPPPCWKKTACAQHSSLRASWSAGSRSSSPNRSTTSGRN